MEKQYTITKSHVEVYKIRTESGMYWADITIDNNGEKGRIQIASDYGDWQYYWGSCGCPFKKFLTHLDIGYTAGKFREDGWFDEEATKRSIYNDIKYRRECRDLTADQAKELIDECQELDFSSKESYQFSFFNSELLCKEFDSCDIPFETNISPLFRQFWNEPWKAFIEQIKQEITQEPFEV